MRTGMVIGERYEVGGLIGRGGFGEVWDAVDRNLRRDVAIKFLTIVTDDPDAVDRYAREARTLATLQHPAVVGVQDAGSLDHEGVALPYLVMERLTGDTWETAEAATPVTRTGAQVADALDHVHGANVVHRDVKPANIMICTGGRVVLMDFGIARDDSSTRRATTTGAVFGTPAYMAPEQLARQPATPASDVYALGLVLVEKLTGQRTPARQLGAEARARIPWKLRKLLERMTSHEGEQRPTAAECAAGLRAAGSVRGARSSANGAGRANRAGPTSLGRTARQVGDLVRRIREMRREAATTVLPPEEEEEGAGEGVRPDRGPSLYDRAARRLREGLREGLRRVRGGRSVVELCAGVVIFLTRVVRDLLILAAAGAGAWFGSFGVATAVTYYFEHPSHDSDGTSNVWPFTVLTLLGYAFGFAMLWSWWAHLTTAARYGRSVFAKVLVRPLIVSLAPVPFLLALPEAPAWTVPATPALVWGGWLLHAVLRRLQKIDERARRRGGRG
ncbi:serine/threonine-protein kinase [Streptomyces sp. NPDC048172]|uniref:serine/threonine-protein kinase n=1 Tax=Streptomyces sp. NPDC048172 TaxID=3365505 RepID=UPI00371AAFAA